MLFKEIEQINPAHGPVWHGSWKAGHIEKNRKIYDFELVFFSRGNGRIITENGTFYCRENTAIIIPPDLIHCTIADTDVERWCIHFDWFGDCSAHHNPELIWVYMDSGMSFQKELCAAVPELNFPYCRNDLPENFLSLIQNHFFTAVQNNADYLKRKGLLLEILGEMLNSNPEEVGKKTNKTFFMVKKLIDTHYMVPELSVFALAEKVCITANHLNKIFKRESGISVLNYIHLRRLQQAQMLLKTTNMTIREIAFQTGFNDANYFSRLYRKYYKNSPHSEQNIRSR